MRVTLHSGTGKHCSRMFPFRPKCKVRCGVCVRLKRMIGRHKGRDKTQQHPHSSSSPPPHVHSHGTGRSAASGSGSNSSSQSATSVSSAGISSSGNKAGSSSGFSGVSNSTGVTGGGTGGGGGFSSSTSSGTGSSPPMNAGDLKDVRVIQRSLVYVIGIPPSIAKKEVCVCCHGATFLPKNVCIPFSVVLT